VPSLHIFLANTTGAGVVVKMKKWNTAKEVADYLQVKPETIRRWLKAGLFPNAKHKGCWLIPECDVMAMLGKRSRLQKIIDRVLTKT